MTQQLDNNVRTGGGPNRTPPPRRVSWPAAALAVAMAAGTATGIALVSLPDPPETLTRVSAASDRAALRPAIPPSIPPPQGPVAASPAPPPGERARADGLRPPLRPAVPRAVAKHIRVDVSRRRVTIYEGGRLVRVLHRCSFGREGHATPLIRGASLSISRRERLHRSTRYYGAPMPYALFLREAPNIAFHGGDTGARSHGCIHLARGDAKWLFHWAGSDPVRVDIVASA